LSNIIPYLHLSIPDEAGSQERLEFFKALKGIHSAWKRKPQQLKKGLKRSSEGFRTSDTISSETKLIGCDLMGDLIARELTFRQLPGVIGLPVRMPLEVESFYRKGAGKKIEAPFQHLHRLRRDFTQFAPEALVYRINHFGLHDDSRFFPRKFQRKMHLLPHTEFGSGIGLDKKTAQAEVDDMRPDFKADDRNRKMKFDPRILP
jgi:hypothetical protein